VHAASEDIADAGLYLISAKFLTSHTLVLDGDRAPIGRLFVVWG
jgi:hypothetical protein